MINELTRVFPGSREWQWIESAGYASSYRGETASGGPVVARVLTFENDDERAHRDAAMARLQAIHSIDHQGIWPVHSPVADEHLFWLSPWFDQHLALKKEPVGIKQWPNLARDLCDALDGVHGAGLLHLNIHPGNVVLSAGRSFLCDISPIPDGVFRTRRISSQQAVLGAHPVYAAPEQIRGEASSAATDIYALACVLVEAFTGRPCWTGPSFTQICIDKTRQPPQLDVTLPKELKSAFGRALAIDPAERPSTSLELAALLGFESQKPPAGARRTPGRGTHCTIALFAPLEVSTGERVLLHFGTELPGMSVKSRAQGSDPRAELRVQMNVPLSDGLILETRIEGGAIAQVRLDAVRLTEDPLLQQLLIQAARRPGPQIAEIAIKQGRRLVAETKFVWFAKTGATESPTDSEEESKITRSRRSTSAPPTDKETTSAQTPPEPDTASHSDATPEVDAASSSMGAAEPEKKSSHVVVSGARSGQVVDISAALRSRGYDIVRELGRGGMSNVYLARQLSLDRPVALKVCRSADANDDLRFQKRFVQEARMLARIHHRNVCAIIDIVATDDLAYFAMEYLSGGSLRDRIRAGSLTLSDVAGVLIHVANGLQHVHELGIVHRDLKPENVLYRENDTPVLVDFGISRSNVQNNTLITQEGMLVGTPTYMSPEQATAATVDARTDIYALGIIAYELLTGSPPFHGDTPIGVLMGHLTAPPPSLQDEYGGLAPIVMQMLSKEPSERIQSMQELASVLAALNLSEVRADAEGLSTRNSLPLAARPNVTKEVVVNQTLLGRLASFVRGK